MRNSVWLALLPLCASPALAAPPAAAMKVARGEPGPAWIIPKDPARTVRGGKTVMEIRSLFRVLPSSSSSPIVIGTIQHTRIFTEPAEKDWKKLPLGLERAYRTRFRVRKISDRVTSLRGRWEATGRDLVIFLERGKGSYSVSTAVLRSAYSPTLALESEFLQRQLAGAPRLDVAGSSSVSRAAGYAASFLLPSAAAVECNPPIPAWVCEWAEQHGGDPAQIWEQISGWVGGTKENVMNWLEYWKGRDKYWEGQNERWWEFMHEKADWFQKFSEESLNVAKDGLSFMKEMSSSGNLFRMAFFSGMGASIGAGVGTLVMNGIQTGAEALIGLIGKLFEGDDSRSDEDVLKDFMAALEAYEKIFWKDLREAEKAIDQAIASLKLWKLSDVSSLDVAGLKKRTSDALRDQQAILQNEEEIRKKLYQDARKSGGEYDWSGGLGEQRDVCERNISSANEIIPQATNLLAMIAAENAQPGEDALKAVCERLRKALRDIAVLEYRLADARNKFSTGFKLFLESQMEEYEKRSKELDKSVRKKGKDVRDLIDDAKDLYGDDEIFFDEQVTRFREDCAERLVKSNSNLGKGDASEICEVAIRSNDPEKVRKWIRKNVSSSNVDRYVPDEKTFQGIVELTQRQKDSKTAHGKLVQVLKALEKAKKQSLTKRSQPFPEFQKFLASYTELGLKIEEESQLASLNGNFAKKEAWQRDVDELCPNASY